MTALGSSPLATECGLIFHVNKSHAGGATTATREVMSSAPEANRDGAATLVSAPPENRYDDVAVVMITRNEEKAVGKVIRDAVTALPGCEVFVIDGSRHHTAGGSRCRCDRHRGARGRVRSPLHAALQTPTRPIIVTVDADDTYPSTAFPELVQYIRDGFDVAGADRLGSRPPATMPTRNWIFNKFFSRIASIRSGTRLRDVHCGQRAYRHDVLKGFEWSHEGLAFPVDLIFWPAMSKMKVVEIPIVYCDRIGESTLDRWPSGKATLQRLFRRRSAIARL